MPTMCKSKLRTLLFFFVHFIYLSLAVYFLFLFFFYLSPLKVCHHARCSFSVGSTCKVVGFFSVGGGFSHIGRLEGRDNGENIEWTNTDHSGVKAPPPTIKNRNKEKKDPNTDAAAGFVRSVVVVGGGINHHRGLTMG